MKAIFLSLLLVLCAPSIFAMDADTQLQAELDGAIAECQSFIDSNKAYVAQEIQKLSASMDRLQANYQAQAKLFEAKEQGTMVDVDSSKRLSPKLNAQIVAHNAQFK